MSSSSALTMTPMNPLNRASHPDESYRFILRVDPPYPRSTAGCDADLIVAR